MSDSAERMRRLRLREAGYELKSCPSGLHWRDRVLWAEGVWRRQGELMKGLEKPKGFVVDSR